MKLKIHIRTPKGQATGTEKKLRPFILGKKKAHQLWVNKDDNQIVWEIEGTVRECLKINKNVARFDFITRKVFDSKMLKKTLRKKLEPGQEEELKDMLLNQTSVEVVKEATAQEMVEANKTWWEKVKETFTRKNF